MRSPNFGERRGGLTPDLVVIHYTAMESCDAAARALCDPAREVSAHYLISAKGAVLALVDEPMRAWHAGAGEWRGAGDVNSRSIGIELSNTGGTPFAAAQMDALDEVLRGIFHRWPVQPDGVIAHSDMAPGRKKDPGPRFDWRRLSLEGLAVWSDACGNDVDRDRFVIDARAFGYPKMAPDLLLQTVRLRFRPWARGPLDGTDCAIMADLAARYGVDRGRSDA